MANFLSLWPKIFHKLVCREDLDSTLLNSEERQTGLSFSAVCSNAQNM